jgi:hypothetical protein
MMLSCRPAFGICRRTVAPEPDEEHGENRVNAERLRDHGRNDNDGPRDVRGQLGLG